MSVPESLECNNIVARVHRMHASPRRVFASHYRSEPQLHLIGFLPRISVPAPRPSCRFRQRSIYLATQDWFNKSGQSLLAALAPSVRKSVHDPTLDSGVLASEPARAATKNTQAERGSPSCRSFWRIDPLHALTGGRYCPTERSIYRAQSC